MKYRPEIDGLRAFAVVPVVLFHSGLPFLQGGFLGVDVFFVISGYLITTIILDDIAARRFSILSFYERRFRRILPAYVVMILASMVFAWLWMNPDQLRNFGQSVLASSLFSSNILFWTEAGYFLVGSLEKPLLHTWSLSVEEQFYIIFPLLLALLSRWRWRWTVGTIACLSLISLGLSEYGWRHVPTANFYMLPFRAWELGVGALCAIFLRLYGPRSNAMLSGVGLIGLLVAMASFTEATPVPSLYALLPVLGTALIVVFSAPGTWVGRLLSLRVIVFIGLISYSTYLWHQPLLAFARIRTIPSASGTLLALAALGSFVLGYLSWRFIERPFRKGGSLASLSQARILGGSLVVLALLGAIGLAGHLGKGFPQRLPARAIELAAFVSDMNPLENESHCAFYNGHPLPAHPAPGCDAFLVDGRADVLFIGDSHSGTISYDAQLALQERGISSYAVTYSGCMGLRGFDHLEMPVGYDCLGYNDSMIAYAKQTGAKVLVITSRFPLYLYGTRFDNGEGGVEEGGEVPYDRVGETPGSFAADPLGQQQKMLAGMTAEVEKLTADFNVVLLDPIPEAGWYVPQLAAKIARFQEPETFTISTDYAAYEQRAAPILRAFDAVNSPRLFRVRPQEVFCNQPLAGRCLNATEREAYYFDNNHLSRAGARKLLPALIAAITAARAQD